jgi:predicted aspartyl protease
MIDDMGIFRTTIQISSLGNQNERKELPEVMVDTGSEFSWIPAQLLRELGVEPVRSERFESADGRILERMVGWAVLYAAGRGTPAVVTFAQPGDMTILGATALEGLNMRIDLGRKELVPAGPVPVAAAA